MKRKLMLLVAMLAIGIVAAAPALVSGAAGAQVKEAFSESRVTSGKASPSVAVSSKGDNVDLCPSVQQVANTGEVANEQGALQYASKADDIDFTGSSLTITPSETAECTQTISQAAAAK